MSSYFNTLGKILSGDNGSVDENKDVNTDEDVESEDDEEDVESEDDVGAGIKDNNDLEASESYYLKAIDYAKNINNDLMVSQLGNNLGSIYFIQNISVIGLVFINH